MKNNYIRRDTSNSNDVDLEQNEQQMPMSYEDEQYNIRANYNNNTNNISRPIPITQAPARNQYVGYPSNSQKDFNDSKFKDSASNYGTGRMSQYQQQQPQIDTQTPIYVPPFLLNNIRPSRHHHNGPYDYLPWSIANIFICVIIALPALFFSVQTRDMKRIGNVKKAKVNSRRSLILNIVASVVGLLTILLAVILRFALYQLFVHNDVQSQNVPIYIAGGRK